MNKTIHENRKAGKHDAIERVSIHGGHSGQYCSHAEDRLDQMIEAYIAKGFRWVGITEHMPPASDRFLYPDERAAGLDAAAIYERFARYVSACRALQHRYKDRLTIFVGFETEFYSGARELIQHLIERFKPDYIVGSVHHVNDIGFDFSPENYGQAIESAGGIEALYCRYFDVQFEMIRDLKPPVVGHLDLIRIFDPDYRQRLEQPEIARRIYRNLSLIRDMGLILDFNVRPTYKGADEPYVSRAILFQARELGVAVVPGDDSHSVATVGLNIDRGIRMLQELGFDTRWRMPAGPVSDELPAAADP